MLPNGVTHGICITSHIHVFNNQWHLKEIELLYNDIGDKFIHNKRRVSMVN